MWRNCMKAIRELWRTFEDVFDPYRPELYYMRGPGPKCRAKRADSVTSAMPAAEVATDFSKVRA